MTLVDLVVVYVVAGVVFAVVVWRKTRARDGDRRAVALALVAIPAWPLWAPFAFGGGRAPLARDPTGADAAGRIEAALREGVQAAEGTPLAALLSRDAAERIASEVARASARRAELDALLAREAFDEQRARRRVGELEEDATQPRALAMARLHLDNVTRLRALRDRDARALDELAELAGALRTQLVLARYAGSSVEGAGGIVSEVWSRVEGLSAALDATELGETPA